MLTKLFVDFAAPLEALSLPEKITAFPSFDKLFEFSLAIALHNPPIILPPEYFEISGLRGEVARVQLINLRSLCKQGSD